jgi:hypothetical protein
MNFNVHKFLKHHLEGQGILVRNTDHAKGSICVINVQLLHCFTEGGGWEVMRAKEI